MASAGPPKSTASRSVGSHPTDRTAGCRHIWGPGGRAGAQSPEREQTQSLHRGLQEVQITLAARLGEAEEKIKVLHSGMCWEEWTGQCRGDLGSVPEEQLRQRELGVGYLSPRARRPHNEGKV